MCARCPNLFYLSLPSLFNHTNDIKQRDLTQFSRPAGPFYGILIFQYLQIACIRTSFWAVLYEQSSFLRPLFCPSATLRTFLFLLKDPRGRATEFHIHNFLSIWKFYPREKRDWGVQRKYSSLDAGSREILRMTQFLTLIAIVITIAPKTIAVTETHRTHLKM
jgi:hypothetical protein